MRREEQPPPFPTLQLRGERVLRLIMNADIILHRWALYRPHAP